ncbi:MAG: DUF4070 domain-containing protein [Bacteroidia bacterium]|nr:DUF4070 domain-containing protein [Bacteroidia bacterium]
MKITLIHAASQDDPLRKTDPFMPLSLPILAGSAPGHDYKFVDMLAGEVPDYGQITNLVGISYRITAEKTAFQIADKYREKNVKVILGGAQTTAEPFKAKNHADAIAVGEGEALWPVILKDFQNDCLREFYVCSPVPFNSKEKTVYQKYEFFDLKNEPLPVRKYYRKKYDFDTVFASRGCPVNCDFCSVPSLFGNSIRLRHAGDVIKEIDGFKNFYYLLDDTVFGRKNTYQYYLELYEAIGKLKKKRLWTGQANLDAASDPEGREVIIKAAVSGLIYAAIGIESLNPQVMKSAGTLSKNAVNPHENTIKQLKENIRFIQEQGIVVSGWFTIGYDEDTLDTFYQVLDFCNDTAIIPVLCVLEALPATRLYDKMSKQNRIDNNKHFNIIHPYMNDTEIMKTLCIINKNAYTLKKIYQRTMFYSHFFEKNNPSLNKKINNKIFKTIFTFILQLKLKKGIIGRVNEFNRQSAVSSRQSAVGSWQ